MREVAETRVLVVLVVVVVGGKDTKPAVPGLGRRSGARLGALLEGVECGHPGAAATRHEGVDEVEQVRMILLMK